MNDDISSLDGGDVDVGQGAHDVIQVEGIIGYQFANKKLLEEALTVLGGSNPRKPNYERLEYLGDSILDAMVATSWMDKGASKIIVKAPFTVHNSTLTVVGMEPGLEKYVRNLNNYRKDEIRRKKASLQQRKAANPNKVYWTTKDSVKKLADVVEAVFGAVFLDSGLQPAFMRMVRAISRTATCWH